MRLATCYLLIAPYYLLLPVYCLLSPLRSSIGFGFLHFDRHVFNIMPASLAVLVDVIVELSVVTMVAVDVK